MFKSPYCNFFLDVALEEDEGPVRLDPDLATLTVGDAKTCSLCSAIFSDNFEQRQHFKLDWHRYNLKRKLQNKSAVGEEEFEKMVEKSSTLSEKSVDAIDIEDGDDEGEEIEV